jgi:hypothetical protein
VPRRSILALALAAVSSALAGTPSPAAGASTTVVSGNWAGYAVTGAHYRRVTGSWTVSRGACTSGQDGYSATWIGLGGYDENAQALEQTGTEFDCSASGRAYYSAWYELVPAAAHTIRMKVRPGDRIAAAVTVSGRRVTLTLRNRTSGKSYSRRATMISPDVSSAEWIVEAPAACEASGRCEQLPLSDFDNVNFSNAHATTTAGRVGTISRPGWSVSKIQLGSSAVPTALGAGGSAFAVAYQGQSSFTEARRMFPATAR